MATATLGPTHHTMEPATMTDPNRLAKPRAWLPFFSFVIAVGAMINSIAAWSQVPSPPPPLTLADAQHRATDDLRQATDGAIGSLITYYPLEAKPVQVLKCRAPNGLDSGQRIAVVTYLVHGIRPDRISDSFLVLRAWLPEYGWDVRTSIYEPRDNHLLNATRDGYLISARADADGQIMIANSTPCANQS